MVGGGNTPLSTTQPHGLTARGGRPTLNSTAHMLPRLLRNIYQHDPPPEPFDELQRM